MSSPFPVPNVFTYEEYLLRRSIHSWPDSGAPLMCLPPKSLLHSSLVLAEKEVIDCSTSSMEYTISLTQLMLAFCP
ncbi:hypothetical protein ACQJBY_058503 [Aegilops geniculata]